MAPRAASPALSENEFDIFDNLAGSDNQEQGNSLGADLGINLDIGSDGGSDDEAFIAAKQAASNRKAANVKGTGKKGGGFAAMGLNALLLKAISQKGFKMATPIQRKAIPLLLQGEDVVGMARTGSGKTAAFVIPMIEKLKTHSAKVGARGIIMSPSRELALQTLKVVKEFGRGTDLRTILLVGGDSLEEQFSSMTTNPDIIIATPGRFLHLKVEMGLDLSSVKYICFDEADRLFEMGFAAQLAEILHALPTSRQTLLFSATLPKSLVEFARAGLQDPKLIRLDAESKISPDLKSAYFTIKSGDRDGALLYLLEQVIKVPIGETEAAKARKEEGSLSVGAKRKRKQFTAKDAAVAESTIIFAATKHRVEYLSELLKSLGYPVSYLYGNLDQTARKAHVEEFRSGLTRILVVTDVAARGVDMPHINHVINYDFPSQPKICVHRVGRTARAGRKGWAYSLCRHVDLPYLLDLQLFLGQRLLVGRSTEEANFAEDFVVGSLAPYQLESSVEIVNKQLADDEDLALLQSVADKGERQYQRTRNQASAPSVHRTKELLANPHFADTHILFKDEVHDALQAKEAMLQRIQGFRPAETVFEIGRRGTQSETAEIMRRRRVQVERQQEKQRANAQANNAPVTSLAAPGASDKMDVGSEDGDDDDEPADTGAYDSDSDDLEVSVSMPSSKKPKNDDFREGEFFMSYLPKENYAEEKAYGVSGGDAGNNFVSAARAAEMSLVNDEIQGFADASKARMRWDKKSKKYVARANDEDGSKGAKMIRGESGQKIAASFRSGRFDDWRKANKVGRMPRVGEQEAPGRGPGKTQHYKHKAEKAPKEADKYRDDYEVQKKRVQEAKEKRIGKFKDGTGKSELKDVNAVQKQRKIQEQRQKKNARPSKKRKF